MTQLPPTSLPNIEKLGKEHVGVDRQKLLDPHPAILHSRDAGKNKVIMTLREIESALSVRMVHGGKVRILR